MRTYPRNSPEAAARIVALLLTCDGHVCSSEERALERLDIAGQLGLAPAQFAQIVQTLCEDHSLSEAPLMPTVSPVDSATLASLLSEIDDAELRRKLIRLCMAVAVADDHLADSEIALLAAILTAWGPATAAPGTRRHQGRAAATTFDARA